MCTERVEDVAGTSDLIEASTLTEFSNHHDISEQILEYHQSGSFLSIEASSLNYVVPKLS